MRGVLVVARTHAALQPLVAAVASLSGIAIERIHHAQIAQHSEFDVQSQKLRSSILSSLSHDLRTPLIRLVGLADTLVDTLSDRQASAPDNAIETAGMLRDQSLAMHRMVTNLLENAAKYSNPGTPIGLTARVCPPNLEVSVCNEGAGFPRDRLDQVFDPFVRGFQEPTVAGTGIGLASAAPSSVPMAAPSRQRTRWARPGCD